MHIADQAYAQYKQHEAAFRRENRTASSGYNPYTLKDYKHLKDLPNSRAGGLGANMGGEEWEKAQRKREAQREYERNLRM